MSVTQTLAQNSNIIPQSDSNNLLSNTLDFLLKYVYENPLKIFEDNPIMKRYSLMAIHAFMIIILFLVLPDKMIYLSYVSAFWIVFLILMVWLTDNLYDTNPFATS